MANAFGALLKEWRGVRRLSQLDLALRASLSSRHLSFLESGRSTPSRLMVLRLAEALDMPRPAANQALAAAGFTPAYPSAPPDSPDLFWARRAVERMLAGHTPYPGFALDRLWNVVTANAGAARLFEALGVEPAPTANMVDLLLAFADGERIANWEDVAMLSVQRLRAEIAHLGGDAALEAHVSRLARHPRLNRRVAPPTDLAVVPLRINAAGLELSLFTTIAQFGSAQEIALSELKIELMFPADAQTEAWLSSA